MTHMVYVWVMTRAIGTWGQGERISSPPRFWNVTLSQSGGHIISITLLLDPFPLGFQDLPTALGYDSSLAL